MTTLQQILLAGTPGPVAGSEGVQEDQRADGDSGRSARRRPVLVPLDGSELAERALPYAVALAQERGAPLLLVRVVAVHGLATANLSTAALTDLLVEAEWAEAEQYLATRVQALTETAPNLVVRSALQLGDPALEVLATEHASHAQFVVLTTHGRTGLARWLRGSVAEQVLRHGQAPVLLVRPWDTKPVEAKRAGGRRVLVALDGSALADQVLAEACRLAQPVAGATGTRPDGPEGPVGEVGEVILATVVQPLHDRHDPAWRVALELERARVRTALCRAAGLVQARGVPIRTVILCAGGADVASAIANLAVNDDADLIALSTHGRGGFGRWLHGSVADQVAHVARVPVLLYHPPAPTPYAEPARAGPTPVAAVR